MFIARPTWSRIGGVLIAVTLATSPVTPAYAASSVDKSETVHVQTDAAGTVSSVTVEDLLSNDAKSSQLLDRSNLSDIDPADDEQSFAQAPDGSLTWSAGGKNVTYKGTSSEKPPVDVTVTYTLDGVPVNPQNLAGASGKLVIRIDYTNNARQERTIGSAQRQISTPFVCMSAVLLDGNIFSNVRVTNGKLLDDKGGMAVIGYAMPGLEDSLDLDNSDLDLDLEFPTYVEIEAQVSNLELDPIYTIVTPELFAGLDTDKLNLDLGDLDEGTDALADAMSALIDGSDALTGVLRQLGSGGAQLGGGVRALKEALGALPNSIGTVKDGIDSLAGALNNASSSAGQLAAGAGENGVLGASWAALDSVRDAQDAVGNARGKVSSLARELDTDLKTTKDTLASATAAGTSAHDAANDALGLLSSADLSTAANEQLAAQKEQLAGSVRGTATDLDVTIEGIEGLNDEQLAAVNAQLAEKLAPAKTQLEEAAAGIEGLSVTVAAPEGLANDVTALQAATEQLARDSETLATTNTALSGAASARASLDSALQSLDAAEDYTSGVADGASNLSGGIGQLSSALSQAADGARGLSDGLNEFQEASPQLLAGIEALDQGVGQLTNALNQTAAGSGQLTEGLSTFNDEGIHKIIDALEGLDDDMGGISDNITALRDAANDYDIFSDKVDGATSSVRFIYKTEQIG